MEKIVIIRGPTVNGMDNVFLKECLRMLFPDCRVLVFPDEMMETVLSKDDRPGFSPGQNC